MDTEKKSSYQSRQPKAGPAPFASFEDLSDYLAEDTSPEEIVPLPEITEEESSQSQSQSHHHHQGNYSRRERDKRESVVTVMSQDYEREFLQRNRDISVTFGFREGGSTQDLRRSAEEPEQGSHFYRDGTRASLRSGVGLGHNPAAGPYVNYNFRMIDAGSKESLMDLERRRRESTTSSVYMDSKEAAHTRGNPTSPTKAAKQPPPLISRVSSISSSSSGNYNITNMNYNNNVLQNILPVLSWQAGGN